MKNITLIKLPNGNKRLIDSEGNPIDAFTRFLKYLEQKTLLKSSTISSYVEYVAHFIDYLIEAGILDAKNPPNQVAIDNAVDLYPIYLSEGVYSRNPFIADIAKKIGKTDGNLSTVPQVSAVNHFLTFSVQLARDMREYLETKKGTVIAAPELIFEALNGSRDMSHHEIQRLRNNSILGANLRKIKATRKTRLRGKIQKRVGSVTERKKDFPVERFEELLLNEPCPRNRALWALLGGGGLRQSEGLALPLDLVNCESQTVRVQDPNDLRGASKYSPAEKLRWKGRETASVYILPFIRKIFFDSYLEYLRIKPISNSGFSFLKLDDDGYGDPLLNATNTTLNDSFKAAQRRIGMKTLYTLHSLRHMFGVFMLNFFPNPFTGELGLSIEDVQTLMGHAEIGSTRVYAQTHNELLLAKLEYAERKMMGDESLTLPSIIASSLRKLADKMDKNND